MGLESAVARILSGIPGGMVRRASEPVERLPPLKTGMDDLDVALDGGWARGRLNILEPGASASTGRTTAACATVTSVTMAGFQTAWVDGDGSLDPVSLASYGADMTRLLWVRGPLSADRTMRAASEIIQSGLFELLVLRTSGEGWPGGSAMQWVRLSREAELSRTTVLVLVRNAWTNVHGAVDVVFEPMQTEWVGQWGHAGYLDGATFRIRPDSADVGQDGVAIRSRVAYRGFP